jgi:hypothetical protein
VLDNESHPIHPTQQLSGSALKHLRTTVPVIDDVLGSTVASLRYLEESEWDDLMKVVAEKNAPSARPTGSLPHVPPVEAELERRKTWRLIEERANQGPFRDALMARDKGRCAVTGSRVAAVIEAAHLIPYALGNSDRDDPANGILLRADIHILFDRGLMAVNPLLRIMWIAAELEDTVYAKLKNRSVRTGAAEENLRWHFEWATKDPAMPQRAEDVPAPVSQLRPPS